MESSVKKLGILFFTLLLIFTFLSQTIANMFISSVKTGYAYSARVINTVESVSVAHKLETIHIYAAVGGKLQDIMVFEGDYIDFDDPMLIYDVRKAEGELVLLEMELKEKQINLLANERIKNELLSTELVEISPDIVSVSVIENEINRIMAEIENAKGRIDIYDGLYIAGAVSTSELEEVKNYLSALEYDLMSKELEIQDILDKNKSIEATAEREYEALKKEMQEEIDSVQGDIDKINLECGITALKIDELKRQIDNNRYEKASVAGKIARSYVFEGQTVFENQHIFDINAKSDDNRYEAVFEISNADSKYFSIGMKVDILYEDTKTSKIEGIITEIKNTGDIRNTKELRVNITAEADIDKQTVKLLYITESGIYDYVVPNSAVKYDGRNYYILTVESKENTLGKEYKAKKMPVYIASRNSSITALKNAYGLETEIVFESANRLTDGEKIYVVGE